MRGIATLALCISCFAFGFVLATALALGVLP